MKSPDCIENKIVLQAPRARVWRAITDADEFGMWFRVKLARPFGEGATAVASGFDGLRDARRAEAFRMNEDGWDERMQNIERHVSAD